jgi:hypothetical protein
LVDQILGLQRYHRFLAFLMSDAYAPVVLMPRLLQ